MADQVQRVLEEMVPELEDLEEKGLLSPEEIRALVSVRKDFEYKLQRRTVLKEDFLRYITYELNLNALRLKRKKRFGLTENSLCDFASTKRISFIYERALRKFKGDKSLWISAIEYAKESQSEKILAKLFARSVQLHPRVADFWIMAASHEMEANGNVGAARQMMQRGLRVNSSVGQMWHEYFRLEFLFLYKVRGRRRVLGIDDAATPGKKRKMTAENNETSAESDEDVDTKAKEREVLHQGAVLKIVYQNAIAAIPGNITFAFQFIHIAQHFKNDTDIGDVAELLIKDISSSLVEMEHEADNEAKLWDLAANFRFKHPDSKLCDAFEELISSCQTTNKAKRSKSKQGEKSLLKALSSLGDRDQTACGVFAAGFESVAPNQVTSLASYFVDFIAARASDEDADDDSVAKLLKMAHMLVTLLVSEEECQVDAATCAKIVQTLAARSSMSNDVQSGFVEQCLSHHPGSCELWLAKIGSIHNAVEALKEMRCALENVQLIDSLELWLLRLDLVLQVQQSFPTSEDTESSDDEDSDSETSNLSKADERILNEFMDTVAKLTIVACKRKISSSTKLNKDTEEAAEDPVGVVLKGMVQWALRAKGIQFVRMVYEAVLKRGIPAILPESVFLEVAQCEASEGDSSKVRRVLEKAILVHPSSEMIWMWYLSFEQHESSQSNSKKVQKVLWRASKKVDDPKGFEEKWLLNRE